MSTDERDLGPRGDHGRGPSTRAGLAVLTVLGVLGATGVAVALLTRGGTGEAPVEVQRTVEAWAAAIEDRDCEAYEALTTADFRRQVDDGRDYDCSTWREAESGAATWTDIVLGDVVLRGDHASVAVEATYVSEYAEEDFIDTDDVRADLVLRERDGAWVLAEVDVEER